MMEWKPIETMPRDENGFANVRRCGGVVVGWWINLGGMSWETSTDELTDCATHWCALPPPPAIGENDERD